MFFLETYSEASYSLDNAFIEKKHLKKILTKHNLSMFVSEIMPQCYLKSHCHVPGLVDFLLSPTPRSLIVFCFTFRFLIYIELITVITVITVRSVSRYIFYMWLSSGFSIICQKRLLFPLCCLCSFVRDQLTISVVLFLGSLFCSIDLIGSFDANSVVFTYCFYSSSLEVEYCQSFNTVLLQYYVGYSSSLNSPYKFQI